MAVKGVIGGNEVRITMVDNTPESKGGLGTIIGDSHSVSAFDFSSSSSTEQIPELGTANTITSIGASSKTFNMTITNAYDLNGDVEDYMKDVQKIKDAEGRRNITIYMTTYEAGTSDSANRDDRLMGINIYNGVVISSVSGGFSSGTTSSQITISGTYEKENLA